MSVMMIDEESTSSTDTFNSEEFEGVLPHDIIKEEQKFCSEQRAKEKSLQRQLQEGKDQKIKRAKALESLNYLLGTSEKYSDYFVSKLETKSSKKAKLENKAFKDELNKIKKEPVSPATNLSANISELSLTYFENGSLRPYQKEGLAWLRILFENGVNGILADEMGLGKTVQVIALICHLIEQKIPGPYLILAPLSTLPNWTLEFKRFAPKIPVVVFHGSKDVRNEKREEIKRSSYVGDFKTLPVVLTSYSIVLRELSFLCTMKWQYIILDEGHRIKNFQCSLASALRTMTSLNRLILTGTPLQNNLLELWSLLNFLMPQFFSNADTFGSLFVLDDFSEDSNKIIEKEQSTNIISTIHRVLSPFMLRRLKCDVLTDMVPKKEMLVFCPLSEVQIALYKLVLQKAIDRLPMEKGVENSNNNNDDNSPPRKRRKAAEEGEKKAKQQKTYCPEEIYNALISNSFSTRSKKAIENKKFVYSLTMASPMSMLKKIVNHPYLVQFPLKPGSEKELLIDENLINSSGKMIVLDLMLKRLKLDKHKVLIFSTMVTILDMVEELFIMRGYKYCRLDGNYGLEARADNILSFNNDPNILAFLISTRAGGLGLNLTGADTVIFFDRDWNPQVDIQAQDRCHRIGQTKPVMVYSLVTKNTIDERIISFGNAKRKLEKIVMKKGKFNFDRNENLKITDIKELQEILESYDHSQVQFSKEKLDDILDRTELYEMAKENKIIV